MKKPTFEIGITVVAQKTLFGIEEGEIYTVMKNGHSIVFPTIWIIDNSGKPVEYSTKYFETIQATA